MPMFEYFCPDCNTRFEKLVRHVTPERAEGGIACPTCASEETRRVLSVFAAVAVSSKGSQAGEGCCGGSGEGGFCGCGMARS